MIVSVVTENQRHSFIRFRIQHRLVCDGHIALYTLHMLELHCFDLYTFIVLCSLCCSDVKNNDNTVTRYHCHFLGFFQGFLHHPTLHATAIDLPTPVYN